MWELLAGRRMYREESDVPLLEQAKRAEIPALPAKGLPLEEKLHAIVTKALAANRDERYPSASAMLRDARGVHERGEARREPAQARRLAGRVASARRSSSSGARASG